MLLDTIHSRQDLLDIPEDQLGTLCGEIRQFLVQNVSRTGGHLASNLGIVETTVAIHRVFDTSRDRLVFDVGHQCYVHKMLTGRMDRFDTLRQRGGLSGFPKPCESVHDAFIAGHASNAVSVALGMARARTMEGADYHVLALMGDGALTGGFPDCLLQQGASKVFAIDVGYGQLAWKIRSDPRVVVMERTNIRYVTPEDLGEPLDLSVVDVSFSSLKIVLPAIQKLLKPTGQVLCLIKPQFEAGKENVGKKGVVRDPAVHAQVLRDFTALAASLNLTIRNLTFSPVKGPEGNIEFLAHLSMQPGQETLPDIDALVAQAHTALKG